MKGQNSCPFYASEVQCLETDKCKWNADTEECEVKTCSDLKTDQECSAYAGDDLTAFLCQWNTSKQLCQDVACSAIKEETRCTNETLGYDGGKFCQWVNGKCQENTCDNAQDQTSCLHESYMNGGVSTCTWVTHSNGQDGQCYTCNGNGPDMNYTSILHVALLLTLLFAV